ncbi:MAG: DMT family transporter [Vulcanibacillus sp.]
MVRGVRKEYIAIVIGVISISTAAVLVKLSTAPSSILAAYRMLFTVIILSVPTLIFNRKEFKTLTKKDLIYSFLSGIFLAFHFLAWFESLQYTSVASSVVIVSLQPIFAMIGVYIFFKERITRIELIGALLAVTGSIIIGWGDFKLGNQAIYGDILALLGAALVTGYWLLGQNVRKRLSLLPYVLLVYCTSFVVLIIYNLISNTNLIHYSIREWIIFIALAIIPTIFGHTALNWAVKYLSTTTISISILAEPIGASILAYIILGEIILVTQVIGGLVIILGISIYLISLSSKKNLQ